MSEKLIKKINFLHCSTNFKCASSFLDTSTWYLVESSRVLFSYVSDAVFFHNSISIKQVVLSNGSPSEASWIVD